MGSLSLATHLSTFAFLFTVGLRRLLCSFSLYLKNPSLYHSKPWFSSDAQLKNVDLFALLFALPAASFIDLLVFFWSSSDHPSYKFSFVQQSTVNFIFWVLLILILYRQSNDTQILNETFTFVLAGISFLVEYMLNGKGFMGVCSVVYALLGGLTLICASSCLYLAVRPTAFFADFFLSTGLVFKGTWVLQAGLNLYTDVFGLKGCQKSTVLPGQDKVDVKCDLEEDSLRGIALINLLFVCHAIGVLVLAFGVFWFCSCNRTFRFGGHSGPLLAELDTESMLIRPVSEFELD